MNDPVAMKFLPLAVLLLVTGCPSKPPEPEPLKKSEPTSEPAATTPPPAPTESAAPSAASAESPAAEPAAAPGGDPLAGKFTLADATKGLPASGKLFADIQTAKGKLECELYDDKAPITVANFVGLARGLRPFKDPSGNWVKKPAYDGTTFHRIIKGFMIQGGDPAGTGAGEPGYTIPDEIWEGAKHDQRGLLCMANRGKDTNGMQFFIMDGAASHLDGGYTIFGKCQPDSVVEALASSPVVGDHATDAPKIESVKVRRAAAKPAAKKKGGK